MVKVLGGSEEISRGRGEAGGFECSKEEEAVSVLRKKEEIKVPSKRRRSRGVEVKEKVKVTAAGDMAIQGFDIPLAASDRMGLFAHHGKADGNVQGDLRSL